MENVAQVREALKHRHYLVMIGDCCVFDIRGRALTRIGAKKLARRTGGKAARGVWL